MTHSTDQRLSEGRAAGGRVPDFFVVGHPKSGTTALYETLRAHPQIFMPKVKEPRFFADDMHDREHGPRPPELPDTLEQYLELFAPAEPGQRAGEASPLYLASHVAAEQIAELAPDGRIVAIVREPASFLRSLHLQLMQSHLETEGDLLGALALEQARRQGSSVPATAEFRPRVLMYSEYVRYVEQLRRYRAVFPPERVLVLIYDDWRSDNEATVRQLLRFLQVDDGAPLETTEANPSVRVRSPQLDQLLRTVSLGRSPAGRAVRTAVKSVTPQRLRRRALGVAQHRMVYAKPQPLDERVAREIRGRFKDEVVALGDYLGRDLVRLWGYGDV
jgi:Sulfotransferase family